MYKSTTNRHTARYKTDIFCSWKTHTQAEIIFIAFERTIEILVSQLKRGRQTISIRTVLREPRWMSGKNTHKELFFGFLQDVCKDLCPDLVFPVSLKTPWMGSGLGQHIQYHRWCCPTMQKHLGIKMHYWYLLSAKKHLAIKNALLYLLSANCVTGSHLLCSEKRNP